MSVSSYDDFVNDDLHNGEHPHRYCPGGLHPVHIDDRLDSNRYTILHKLGYGASSTVWLAQDRRLQKYVALKIKEADISKFHNELDILKHISKFKSVHPGRIYSAASILLRQFWIDGPNGRHLALVFRIAYTTRTEHRPTITKGLAYLHSERICHGDLGAENILLRLTNFDSWPERKLHAQLGSPRMLDIDRGPGRPRYLVDSAYFFKADPGLLTKNIVIVDHSESFFIKSPPLQQLQYTNYYAAPEVLLGCDADIYSDIWAIGCLIYEMHSGTPLFHLAIQNPPNEALYEITEVLGKLPPHWDPVQSNDNGYSGRYGSDDPVDESPQIAKFPLDVIVKDIEAERVSLPKVNIGVKGGKPPRKGWKTKPVSSEIHAHIKTNLDIYWKPFPSARYAGIDETEGSSRHTKLEGAMSRSRSGPGT